MSTEGAGGQKSQKLVNVVCERPLTCTLLPALFLMKGLFYPDRILLPVFILGGIDFW